MRSERGTSEKTSEDGESTIISTRQYPAGSDAADCIKYLEANGPSRTQELAGFIRAVHILVVGVPARERCVSRVADKSTYSSESVGAERSLSVPACCHAPRRKKHSRHTMVILRVSCSLIYHDVSVRNSVDSFDVCRMIPTSLSTPLGILRRRMWLKIGQIF
jgi:hypothetical protein